MDKRDFLRTIIGAGVLQVTGSAFHEVLAEYKDSSATEVAGDDRFWLEIRKTYRLKPDYINLENGYYCFVPEPTLEAFMGNVREVNYQGSYYMRSTQWTDKDAAAHRLAKLIGANEREVIITRNTTESLDTIIGGFSWRAGDEAVFAQQDYGSMQNMFKLMASKHDITNRIVSVPLHPANDDEIVKLYSDAITDRTRLLMVCHMVNITGQILPIRKICDMAHARGVQVMVDGAHAVGHISFDIKELDCDYYGSSLHKWLSTPLGAGLLYVKEGMAKYITPMMASWGHEADSIKKLNHTGTHPVHTDLSIHAAIDYLEMIGLERKETRLRWLQKRWSDALRDETNVVVNTPSDPIRHAGIGNVGVTTMPPAEMAKRLLSDHAIWTVAIDGQGLQGCRITPNVYTTAKEIDAFVDAVRILARG